jgi:hypothetical protein
VVQAIGRFSQGLVIVDHARSLCAAAQAPSPPPFARRQDAREGNQNPGLTATRAP